MTPFLRRAESILTTASASAAEDGESVIVVDRQGGMRMFSASGWSLDGLAQELGAAEIYRIRRLSGTAAVEAWSCSEQCALSIRTARGRFNDLAGGHSAGLHARMLQVLPGPNA